MNEVGMPKLSATGVKSSIVRSVGSISALNPESSNL